MKNILILTLCLLGAVNFHVCEATLLPKKQTTSKIQAVKQAPASHLNATTVPTDSKLQAASKPSLLVSKNVPAVIVPEPRLVSTRVVVLPQFVLTARERWSIVDDPLFVARDPNIQEEAEMLRDAYILMSRANADYKGHRIAAMRQTAAAAKCLGMTLNGESHGQEDQGVSDSELSAARELLIRAQAGLDAKGRPCATQDAGNTIHQIDIALSIH